MLLVSCVLLSRLISAPGITMCVVLTVVAFTGYRESQTYTVYCSATHEICTQGTDKDYPRIFKPADRRYKPANILKFEVGLWE